MCARKEGIAVGTGPRTVAIGIRVAPDGIAHPRDHPIDTRAAAVEQDLQPSPEPIIVRCHPVDAHRRRAVGDTEPEDLVGVKRGALIGFTAIQVWTEKTPRHDTAGAANTWINDSCVTVGSGESPVGSRRA